MKILVGFFLLVLLFPGCNNASRNKYRAEDSLAYYPPTPQKMQLEEFRNYYRLLSSFFDTTLLNKGFNGGILIAKNGEVIYEKYAGKIDIRKKDSLSNTTPLHIASTSKTFTAIAILRLVQEKKISLDDTLQKFFRAYPMPVLLYKCCYRTAADCPIICTL
ncbi:MAG: beta-lactamase family protein [Chitinophagaceae bacterium]|nr:beta-lactamase family protein [Chitinophagaceae bacterium]